MATVLALILLTLAAFIFWWYLKYWNFKKLLKKYPGPTPLPIIGNAHLFSSTAKYMSSSMRLCKKYGGTIKVMIGFRPKLFVADHKLAEFILSNNAMLEKSIEYENFHSWLGFGLLTSPTPTFNLQILEKFIDVFNAQSEILVNTLSANNGKEFFDIFPYMASHALNIICETAMGTSFNEQNDSDLQYVRAVNTMTRIVMERSFNPIKMWNFLFTFTKDYQMEQDAITTLHSYTNSVIKIRKQELLGKAPLIDEATGIKRRLAFLDLLLQCKLDGNPLSDEVLREEVDIFMVGGHDRVASAISTTLYCLAHNPNVQQKVVSELKDIFYNDTSKPPTLHDLQSMKYLEMVIKESMRLYPPIPTFGRTLKEDVEFDGGIIPKGISLMFIPAALHRNAHFFPDPEKFDPERFSVENSTGRPAYAYIPFSAGPRNCIGQRFGMLEIKATVSKLLRNFEVSPDSDHVPIFEAASVLRTQNGILLTFKKRDFK